MVIMMLPHDQDAPPAWAQLAQIYAGYLTLAKVKAHRVPALHRASLLGRHVPAGSLSQSEVVAVEYGSGKAGMRFHDVFSDVSSASQLALWLAHVKAHMWVPLDPCPASEASTVPRSSPSDVSHVRHAALVPNAPAL